MVDCFAIEIAVCTFSLCIMRFFKFFCPVLNLFTISVLELCKETFLAGSL